MELTKYTGMWEQPEALPNTVTSLRIHYGSTNVYVFINPENDMLGVSVFKDKQQVVIYNDYEEDEE